MDIEFMKIAIQQAQIARDIDEVPVGAVIVHNGQVVAIAHNMRETSQNAIHHAEILAIEEACKHFGSWRLVDCDLYVTLEPCPMCAGAIINSRIANVYFGAYDSKAGCCGSVYNLFESKFNHQPNVMGGIMEQECSEMLSSYFKTKRGKKC